MQNRAHGGVEKIFGEHQKFKLQLQAQREELAKWEKELEARQANNENERRKFDLQKQMVLN